MRRALLLVALAAVAAPGAAHAQAPPLRAKLASCLSGPDAGNRTAVFTGSMPSIKGTRRMLMRFDLLARGPVAAGFAPLKVPGLGVWQKSAPGRPGGFVFTQRVQALVAPGAYLAVVHFRWYGKGGKLLRSATRTSSICKQPDQRPDLRAGTLDAARGPLLDQATYDLEVRNDGHSAATGFDVVLTVGGAEQPPQHVAGIAPAATTTVTFVGPRCAPGSTLRFELDAEDAVEESSEADDVVERACPFS
jgi:hypothetical protein